MTLRPNSRFYLFNGGTMQIAQVLRDTSEFPSNLIHDSINVTARTVNMPYQYGVFVNTISPASFVENMHIAGRTFPTKNFALRPDGFPSNPRIYWWKVSASYVPDCTIGDEKFNNISVFDAACNSTAPLALIDLYVAAFCQRSGGCGT
jgi:hypothetical protein